MEKLLAISGLAVTAALSFSMALLLAWTTLVGLLRLLRKPPASRTAKRLPIPQRETRN